MSFWRMVKLASLAIVVGVLVYELGAPLYLRWDLDRGANRIADKAAAEFKRTHDSNKAEDVARAQAAKRHMLLKRFRVLTDPRDAVSVTVTKQIRAFVLDDVGATDDWYIATRTADSETVRPFHADEKK